MSKWELHHTPDVDGMQYTNLEQKGEENFYRFTGRDETTGDLVRILGTAEEIDEQLGKKILTDRKNLDRTPEGRAKFYAEDMKNLFLKMKEKYPLQDKIDIYKIPEGKDIIEKLLTPQKDEQLDPRRLFHLLHDAMKEQGLQYERPSYDYFIEKNMQYAGFVKVSFLWEDLIKEQECQRRASECAAVLQGVYKEVENDDQTDDGDDPLLVNIYKDDEGKEAITKMIDWAGENAKMLLDNYLKPILNNNGLDYKRPSYDYFVDPEHYGEPYLLVQKIATAA